MEHDAKRSFLWRSRAIALLAGVIFALSLLSGLPGVAQDFIFAIISLLIIFIALAPVVSLGDKEIKNKTEEEESAQTLIDRYFSE